MFVPAGADWSAEGDARAVSVLVHDPEPVGHACGRRLRRGREGNGNRRPPVRARCAVRLGDAVHRPDPAGPGAGPLSLLRRGDLRAGGRGLPRHRGRAGPDPPRHVHPPAEDASCTASRTPETARCACSACSARQGHRRRRTTPTARLPSSPRARRAERCRISSARSTSCGKGTSPAATGQSPAAAARSPSCRSPCRHASRSPRARRAPRSCSRRRTPGASRCRSRAS